MEVKNKRGTVGWCWAPVRGVLRAMERRLGWAAPGGASPAPTNPWQEGRHREHGKNAGRMPALPRLGFGGVDGFAFGGVGVVFCLALIVEDHCWAFFG